MSTKDNSFEKSRYLIENFDRAISEGWIEVYYQPIVRAANGRVSEEEALVRWDDPMLDALNPMDFIPVLEAVNLVHELDLYVLEQVLKKMEEQAESGLYVVPTAVNLSQIDFYSCDIVDEFVKRVDASGIDRGLIAIEVSEHAISKNNEFIMEQLSKFKNLGFKLWMDDYGSGDAAPVIMQRLKFDLLKINMFFINQMEDNMSAKVIVTELIRMAMAINIEAVAEGVETVEQIEALKEAGCAKLQGYYYCKPVPKEKIFVRYKEGKAIGFENPEETEYYETVGKLSLYDLSFAHGMDDDLEKYFDTMPMAIVEVDDEKALFLRTNKSFKKFIEQHFKVFHKAGIYEYAGKEHSVGYYAMNTIRQCAKEDGRKIIDERTSSGVMVQVLIQRVATNPVTNMSAVVVVVLSISTDQAANETLTYNYIARALSEDYIHMFFIDMNTDEYVEYTTDSSNRDINIESQGEEFFVSALSEATERIYKEDLPLFFESFNKSNIQREIKEHGTFKLSYRLLVEGIYKYVMLKAVRVRTGANKIIMGVTDIDEHMKRKEALERIKEERVTFNRIAALSGDFICIYAVNPKTEHYLMYKSSDEYYRLSADLLSEGESFFEETRNNARYIIDKEDLDGFIQNFTKKNIYDHIGATGLFVYNYRINVEGNPIYVCLKAALVEEVDGPQLIVGLINVDRQVRKELEYAESLLEAEERAVRDELTGVKNKHAYVDAEIQINAQLRKDTKAKFAVIVCDLNNLKEVNDTKGHQAGDDYIRNGCTIICHIFTHSPVFRVGGDEFVVLVQGSDYENLDELLGKMNDINKKNKRAGEVTIAVGCAKYQGDASVEDVFKRADYRMYENKKLMKGGGK